jgi:hypothetical protein
VYDPLISANSAVTVLRSPSPIVLNLGTIGILLWVRARGEAYIADDTRWCGLRFIEQLTWASAIALAI